MSTSFTAVCVQFTAGPDPEPNLRVVSDLIRRARDAGADFIVTPEASNFIESGRRRREKARPEADDLFLAGMCSLARETGAWLLIGSLVIDPAGEPGAVAGETRLANRSFLVDSTAPSSRDTTRSTCSTSICRMARAIAKATPTGPAAAPSSPRRHGVGLA